MTYFSDRERGGKPRGIEVINETAWRGIAALIEGRTKDASLGFGFPKTCDDNSLPIGTDENRFTNVLGAEIPEIAYPFEYGEVPETIDILDLIEFVFRNVGKPENGKYHSFFDHYHLTYDEPAGKQAYCSDINRLFARQGLAYELTDSGLIVRTATTPGEITLKNAEFNTGDSTLDSLLSKAKNHYFSPDPNDSIEAVKELWDSWERMKTIVDPTDKKRSISHLISKTGGQTNFVSTIESEATELTRIGNNYQIRHHEVGKTPVETPEQTRYFFQRLYALVDLLMPFLQR